jgi:hypothetical protein
MTIEARLEVLEARPSSPLRGFRRFKEALGIEEICVYQGGIEHAGEKRGTEATPSGIARQSSQWVGLKGGGKLGCQVASARLGVGQSFRKTGFVFARVTIRQPGMVTGYAVGNEPSRSLGVYQALESVPGAGRGVIHADAGTTYPPLKCAGGLPVVMEKAGRTRPSLSLEDSGQFPRLLCGVAQVIG